MNDYMEVRVDAAPCSEDITDVLAALLADSGFESFVPDSDGLTAYIKKELFDESVLDNLSEICPFDTSLTFSVTTVEGRDWNSEWEKNYFKPIVIDDRCVIHSSFHENVPECRYDIAIDPKMAFGTGHHATTSQMVCRLLDNDIDGKKVVDMGTGTGILAILAAMRGASHVTAVEIDPFAHANAIENLKINHVDQVVDLRLGDVTAISAVDDADILLANINRNIVIADMAAYSAALRPGGLMFLSGFYDDDVAMVAEAAAKCRLRMIDSTERQKWACVMFVKE